MNNKLFAFFVLFFSIIHVEVSAIPRCEELYNRIYNDKLRKDVNLRSFENVKSIGFRLEKIWATGEGEWKLKQDNNGFFSIGKITKEELNGVLKVGDTIKRINGLDLRDLIKNKEKQLPLNSDISQLFDENENIDLEIIRNKKSIQINNKIKVTIETYDEPYLDVYINSIEINEKDGTFDASITTDYLEIIDRRYSLTKNAWDVIAYDKVISNEKLKTFWYEDCYYSEKEWNKLNSVDPKYGVKFANLVREERQLRDSEYSVKLDLTDWDEKSESFNQNNVNIGYSSTSFYTFKNNFNLRTFPFDTQKIKIFSHSSVKELSDQRFLISAYTQKELDKFKNNNSINGWNIKNADLYYDIFEDPKTSNIYDGYVIELEVERKSGYYLFKIIIPILLILAVCWSSIWIDQREIESRLTVTIVCLLSLIAYNFVIDNELPKLEYLTVMDYIILISYIYATIPNFLSIYSFQLVKHKKRLIAEKYERYEKIYGLPSYILIITIIVITSLSNNVANAPGYLSWIIF